MLDPIKTPVLTSCRILVETHSAVLTETITARFSETHHVTRIGRTEMTDAQPDYAEGWPDLDRLLALWEWRSAPTPWFWMRPKT